MPRRFTFAPAGLIRVLAAVSIGPACAGAESAERNDDPPAYTVWSGAIATDDSVFAYSGLTYALDGNIDTPGWRLRLQGGSGGYDYTSTRTDGLNVFDVRFFGQTTIVDVLAGSEMRFGNLSVGAYAGAQYQRHDVAPFDADNPVQGEEWGAKGVLEAWWNLDDAWKPLNPWGSWGTRAAGSFASAYADYSTAFDTYGSQVRFGAPVRGADWFGPTWMSDLWPGEVWIGVEAGAFGNQELNAGRIGGFVRWRTQDYGTLWLSGGLSGDYDDPSTPYLALTYVNPLRPEKLLEWFEDEDTE